MMEMNERQIAAVKAVVEYGLEDKLKHYLAQLHEDERDRLDELEEIRLADLKELNHIYPALLELKEWLEETPNVPF